MPDVKWIKITTEMFDDEKIRIIEAMPEADTLIVIWVRLICMAGKNNDNGRIYLSEGIPYSVEELANIFNRPLNTVRLAMQTFQRLKMVEVDETGVFLLTNFERHQNIEGMERVRANTRRRVAAHRERRKTPLLALENDVTLPNVTVTGQNRIEKNREEKSCFDNWLSVLQILERDINASNFRVWLVDSIGIETTDSHFVIGVYREEQAAYLETNLGSLIERAIIEGTGQKLQPRFVLLKNEID